MLDLLDAPVGKGSAANRSTELSAPALRGFFRIAAIWGLNSAERRALLGVPRATFFKYQSNPEHSRISRDTLERISYVFGIYKALAILLPHAADGWVKRPNAAFGGRSALEFMTRGGNVADLYRVRRYLDGERGA